MYYRISESYNVTIGVFAVIVHPITNFIPKQARKNKLDFRNCLNDCLKKNMKSTSILLKVK